MFLSFDCIQVEGSPRPSSQKSSAAIEPAAVTLQKKPTGKTEQPPASNGGGKLNSETPVPKQTAKSKKKKQAVEATGTESVTKVAEEGNEGMCTCSVLNNVYCNTVCCLDCLGVNCPNILSTKC